MAKSYVKFEVSKDVVAKTYEALQLAKQSGKVRKGVNEVTKSIERGVASFVVMAEDVEPEEIMVHIPSICEQKKIPFSYVPTKQELGKAIGMNVPCSAISVEDQGSASNSIKDVISKITGTSQKQTPKKEEKKGEGKEAKREESKEESKEKAKEGAKEKAKKEAEEGSANA